MYCPRKNCNTPVIEESDNLGQCVKCKYAFCTLCFQSWHPGTVCMTAEDKIRALEMRGKRSNMNKFRKKLEKLRRKVNQHWKCSVWVANSAPLVDALLAKLRDATRCVASVALHFVSYVGIWHRLQSFWRCGQVRAIFNV